MEQYEDFEHNIDIDDGTGYKYRFTIPSLPQSPFEILNYKLSKHKQKWIAPRDHVRWNSLSLEEQKSLYERELYRRKNGVFFFNNGKIEYLTGLHYFYLTYWYIGRTLPEWRESDRDFFYVWDICEKDRNCYGLLFISDRRSGKTYKGTCLLYEATTLVRDEQSGIQSKTDVDAERIFQKMIKSWKRLPDYWKPVDTGETSPKKIIRFEEPARRSSKGVRKEYKNVLNSFIDYESSKEEAYDGTRQFRNYQDEIGKPSNANPERRWYIIKPCLEEGKKIIGKTYLSSTVEETNREGGEPVGNLWRDSNPAVRKEDGRTITGLYRYFKPAQHGLNGFMDEYGYSVINNPLRPYNNNDGEVETIGALEYIRRKRSSLTGSKLNEEKRKYPTNVMEAFILDSKGEGFPADKIYEQLEHNASVSSIPYRVGDFLWDDEEKTSVRFVDKSEGLFKIGWMPPVHERNSFSIEGIGRKPKFWENGCIGVDPFDHKTTVDSRRSNAAIVGFRSYDPMDMFRSNCFVFTYCYRRETPLLFFDDILKAAMFYSWDALIENQKPGAINHLRETGFGGFVKKTKQSILSKEKSSKLVEGISTAGDFVRETLMDKLHGYIHDFVGTIDIEVQLKKLGISETDLVPNLMGYCPFEELLKDWLHFETGDWTKYDISVASMLALTGANTYSRRRVVAPQQSKMKPRPLFSKRRIR